MSITRTKWVPLVGALLTTLTILSAHPSAKEPPEKIIKVTAKKFEFSPERIVLKKGEPVTLELTSLDRKHGFAVPELGIHSEIKPGETARVRIVPDKAGTFAFHCDVFCGDGHEGMSGVIVVEP
jgi:cytochrome c oxidase subunit 2